ncbi:kinase-like domain-containing protein [Rhizophagus clarus]|uniref:Kinase-like domain-containing protein n=1 Tax=Rhizophagus clarus TaxID=94130 RepID=A0A8H3QE10_9GLOM|nr:kinase-like domain-containing protein [Rhizophagus clarus]
MEEKPKNLWKINTEYEAHVTISTIDSITESEDADKKIYMKDLEKRKQVYGICGECNEPEGGFGKIYSAQWPEGHIKYWDIKNQKWNRYSFSKYALKSLKNSFDICSNFLKEIESYLQLHLNYAVQCYGITQDPKTKEYMMVLFYCYDGNLRKNICESKHYIEIGSKIDELQLIAKGLLDIHNSGFVHKDFHSVMNELLSEEIPYNGIPHDNILAIAICRGRRPEISEGVPKLLSGLIIKCWDAKLENRPAAKELYYSLNKWYNEIIYDKYSEIGSQVVKCDKIGKEKFKNRSSTNQSKNTQTHPLAIYTSRLLYFKNLPKPVNSSNLSSFQFNSDTNYATRSISADPISKSCQLDESELCGFWKDNIE